LGRIHTDKEWVNEDGGKAVNDTMKRAVDAIGWLDLSTSSGTVILINSSYRQAIARAVLMAVREPDDVVADKGMMFMSGLDHYPTMGETADTFTAMIDAILNEDGKL